MEWVIGAGIIIVAVYVIGSLASDKEKKSAHVLVVTKKKNTESVYIKILGFILIIGFIAMLLND